MPVVLAYALLAVTPALALIGAGRLLDRWARGPGSGRPRTSWWSGRSWWSGGSLLPRQAAPAPAGPSLERLVADLRRLEADYRRIAASDLPGRVSRMRTVTLAYDDVLRACCRAVGLDEPATPFSSLDRLQTEAALSQQGLTW